MTTLFTLPDGLFVDPDIVIEINHFPAAAGGGVSVQERVVVRTTHGTAYVFNFGDDREQARDCLKMLGRDINAARVGPIKGR
jgi:hypothetical protein